jgi:hypothetical protein
MKSPFKELMWPVVESSILQTKDLNEDAFVVTNGDPWKSPVTNAADPAEFTVWIPSEDEISESSTKSDDTLSRRVRFLVDENDKILTECFDNKSVCAEEVRELCWLNAEDFRQFRLDCHHLSQVAILDKEYVDFFLDIYESCKQQRDTLPTPDATEALEYSNYRGVEKSIFRSILQTDKSAAIQSVIRSQETANINVWMNESDKAAEIAKVYLLLTASTKRVARVLAEIDTVVAIKQTRTKQSVEI